MFLVEFTAESEKDLGNIEKYIADNIVRIVKKELSNYPSSKGKVYGKSSTSGLVHWQKGFYAYGGFRVFYTIVKGVVTVEEIIYEGKVSIKRVTPKKYQKKVARELGL